MAPVYSWIFISLMFLGSEIYANKTVSSSKWSLNKESCSQGHVILFCISEMSWNEWQCSASYETRFE